MLYVDACIKHVDVNTTPVQRRRSPIVIVSTIRVIDSIQAPRRGSFARLLVRLPAFLATVYLPPFQLELRGAAV
jgi:hypothetical protein